MRAGPGPGRGHAVKPIRRSRGWRVPQPMISIEEILGMSGALLTVLGGVWKISSQVTKVQTTVMNTAGDVIQVKGELKTNTAATQEVERKVKTVEDMVRKSAEDFKGHVTDDLRLADRIAHIEGHLGLPGVSH